MGSPSGHGTQSAGEPRTRGRARGNDALGGETSAGSIKSNEPTATKLTRIAQMSRERSNGEVRWLMPHFNARSFKACFDELDGKKAVGADGMNKDTYGEALDKRIDDLLTRMKSMSYRPGPVREVLILTITHKYDYRFDASLKISRFVSIS